MGIVRDVEELSLGSEIEIDLEKTMGATARFFKLTLPHYIKGAGLRLNDLTSPEITDMPITRSTANTQEIKIMKAWERVEQYEKKVVTVYKTLQVCANTQMQPYRTILVNKYIEGFPDWQIANTIQYSDRQYHTKKKLALCEFAECLETQKIKNGTLDMPVLLRYKE